MSTLWFDVDEDKVCLLRDGRQAFPAMLDAIAKAEREVLLEMYWVGADAAGELFRAALTTAAKRGVTVRVIYDALGSRNISLEWWRMLTDAGGEVFEFHPFWPVLGELHKARRQLHKSVLATRWHLLEQRDHRKILVIDGHLGFTGGINLGLEWLPVEEGGAGWRDAMIAVDGPATQELRTLFFRTRRRFVKAAYPIDVLPLPAKHTRPVWVLSSRAVSARLLRREYAHRIAGARRSIDIANSYFIPDRRIRRALARASARGVRVRVLVPQKSDQPFVQFAVEALFDALIRRGIEVYTLPGPMLHAKTAIIDDEFTTVGSYNLDERSWRKNLEVNLAVLDAPFARYVRSWFERDLAEAKRVTLPEWRERSWGRKGLEVVARSLRKLW